MRVSVCTSPAALPISLPSKKSLVYYADMCRLHLLLSFIAKLIAEAIVWISGDLNHLETVARRQI